MVSLIALISILGLIITFIFFANSENESFLAILPVLITILFTTFSLSIAVIFLDCSLLIDYSNDSTTIIKQEEISDAKWRLFFGN